MQPDSPQPTILVVDDNADNRALARATLEDEGLRVVLATTGEDGIKAFEVECPDCVLLDVRMPGTDGFAVCERIRSRKDGANTPIIFLTALRDVDTFDRALSAGGDDFLTKPVRPSELLIRVQSALKLRRMGKELREHYDLVRQQRDNLMRLQLQKERLTAFVVHDLKNPLSALDLDAQVLLREHDLSTTARDSVQRIRDEVRALMRLILNLLDISRSDEGQLTLHRKQIDVEALVREVVDLYRDRARIHGVTLQYSIRTKPFFSDPDVLRRVLENLVDNALRYAPAGSEVLISAKVDEAGIEIRVADAGPGVPETMRNKIFERFVQLEKNDRGMRTGRGLGLAFCKLAIEAHGGSIRIEDANPGAVFCMRLPYVNE